MFKIIRLKEFYFFVNIIGLVGLHLLIYGSDRDNRPCTILPIHGYMARAAPNAIPRDQRRSESTFEIFRPGCRTFQVIKNF